MVTDDEMLVKVERRVMLQVDTNHNSVVDLEEAEDEVVMLLLHLRMVLVESSRVLRLNWLRMRMACSGRWAT